MIYQTCIFHCYKENIIEYKKYHQKQIFCIANVLTECFSKHNCFKCNMKNIERVLLGPLLQKTLGKGPISNLDLNLKNWLKFQDLETLA